MNYRLTLLLARLCAALNLTKAAQIDVIGDSPAYSSESAAFPVRLSQLLQFG